MTALCKRNEVREGQPIGIEQYVLLEKSGKLYIYRNECPHMGIPLEWMENQFLDTHKDFIQCASHGALFTLETGLCIKGPCNGASLTAIPFTLDEGWIFI